MSDQHPIDDTQISHIINNVMRELNDPTFSAPAPAKASKPISIHPSAGDGLFPDPDSAVAAAQAAYEQLADLPLELRKQMVAAMRATAREHAEEGHRLRGQDAHLSDLHPLSFRWPLTFPFNSSASRRAAAAAACCMSSRSRSRQGKPSRSSAGAVPARRRCCASSTG